jgi:hypothetical protein
MCYECCSSQIKNSISRSGSIAEDPKFDGPSADDMMFEGVKSNSGDNPNIGKTGWGS